MSCRAPGQAVGSREHRTQSASCRKRQTLTSHSHAQELTAEGRDASKAQSRSQYRNPPPGHSRGMTRYWSRKRRKTMSCLRGWRSLLRCCCCCCCRCSHCCCRCCRRRTADRHHGSDQQMAQVVRCHILQVSVTVTARTAVCAGAGGSPRGKPGPSGRTAHWSAHPRPSTPAG